MRRSEGGATEPTRFPWLWLLPGVLVVAGLLVWGIVVYPDLPARVPQHFGSDGVDNWADKSVASVFLPVLVPAGSLVVLSATALGTLRVTPTSELAPGQRVSSLVNRPSTREGARRIAQVQLFLGCCVGLSVAGGCTAMWSTDPARAADRTMGTLVLVLTPMVLGVVATLVTALRDRKQASATGRCDPGAPSRSTGRG